MEQKVSLCDLNRLTPDEGEQDVLDVREVELQHFPRLIFFCTAMHEWRAHVASM